MRDDASPRESPRESDVHTTHEVRLMIQGVKRTAKVYTTLPEGELVFFGLTGRETLGRPFEYHVELLSENPDIGLSALLGQPISVTLELPDYTLREFNGVVTHFWYTGVIGRHAVYRAVVRPWLSLLSRRAGSRVFQAKTVPDVIRQVVQEHGFSDLEEALSGEYRTFEYLVQYRESDLNFLSRLMELEGIYCFFTHKDGKHKLVLADSYSAHEPAPGYESVPYFPPQSGERRERDHIYHLTVRRAICSGTFSARDFNFTRPAEPIANMSRAPLDHAYNEYEVYDYPGQFQDTAEAETLVRIRLEEQQADFEQIEGEGNARGLSCGGLFALTQFPREDQNKEYLIVHAEYEIKVGDYESMGRSDQSPDFRVSFLAMESSRPYRAPRITKRPVVEGPQTALVVGPSGHEIWTDEYGRVRLQFHWDREGTSDENSSCWVRVSQAWAGMNWGSIHIPRIGHEVIVEFLEGDPDRPIITGRVYNADNLPPYALPTHQTQSGIKSRSTKGGTPDNFNEIRFEDKKGEEELYVQAEKNQNTLVKANQSITVGANQTVSVGANQTVSVGANQSIAVEGTRSLTVTKADTESFKDTRETTVDKTDTLTITGKHTGTYNGERHETVKTLDKNEVSGNKSTTVHGTYDITADTHWKVVQGANSLLIEKKMTGVSEGPISFSNGPCELKLEGGKIQLTASEEISLVCGGASITLTKTGAVEISGAQKVSLGSGPSAVAVEPSGANVSGPKVGAHAVGMHEISGALVKIN
ncbi:type VI secretion system Vgr family protein [Myxococcota bacterium]